MVGYNQVHYESLHPVTDTDIEKTKQLVNSYVSGTYCYKKNDIQFLICSTSGENSINSPHSSQSRPTKCSRGISTNSYEVEFPLLEQNIPDAIRREQKEKMLRTPKSPPQKKLKSIMNPPKDENRLAEPDITITNEYFETLEEIKKIKNKDRTEAQKCIYRDLMKLQRKEKKKESVQRVRAKKPIAEIVESNIKAKERMASLRSRETSADRLETRFKDRDRKAISRSQETTEDELERNSKNKESMQKSRAKETSAERLETRFKDMDRKAI